MRKNEIKTKYTFLYRVQGGKSWKKIDIRDGKIVYTDKIEQMLYIGTKEHMPYFLRKRTLCKKTVDQIFEEKTLNIDVKQPVEVVVMVVPVWYDNLISYYAEDRTTKEEKYGDKNFRKRFTPELTDLSTPGKCYGIAYHLKSLLSEVAVYAEKYQIKKESDIVRISANPLDLKTCTFRTVNIEIISQLLCKFDSKMISLGEEPIPDRYIKLIERDIGGINEKINKERRSGR